MNKIRNFFSKKYIISTPLSILLIVILSGIVTFIMLASQPNGLMDLYNLSVESDFLMPLLNWLPVLLLMLCLYFAFSSAVISAGLGGAVIILMAIVNRFKLQFRNDPFLPWDLALTGEALNVVNDFSANFIPIAVAGILLIAALIILTAVKLKSRKLPIAVRIAGPLSCILIFAVCNMTLYQDTDIYDRLPVQGNKFNQVDTFNSKGFLYSFIYNANVYRLEKPDYYDTGAVEAVIASAATIEAEEISDAVKPHIIMIMSEAFSWHVSENDHIDFEGYTDPLENYKSIIQSENTVISGIMIPPAVGGGTADTEFDVLTGLATRNFGGVSYSYRFLSRDFESMPSLLGKLGYTTIGMHPGERWFYSRENAYEFLGFDTTMFVEDFENDTKGGYVSEAATFDKIIEVFGGHLEENPGTPLFEFCVTIQNHGGYNNKYFTEGTNFNTGLDLTEEETNLLANYFEGLTDSDIQLARLVEYLEELDEPVIFIYYGDHIPTLTTPLYNALIPNSPVVDSLEWLTRLYKVPYFIWQNSAAAENTQINDNAETDEMPENALITSNYLGAYVMELLGFDGISPYFSYTNYMRTLYPVLLEDRAFDADENSSANAGESARASLILYRNWMYYKVFDEK